MIDFKTIVDFIISRSAEVQSRLPQLDWLPGATTLAVGAIVIGLVLSLWGNRLLRLFYVLVFIGAGGAAGVHAARATSVDLLIGLVLGAGMAGLAGHLLFRWWVGVTAACCAALVVISTAGVRNLPDVQAAFEAFHKERGVGVVASQTSEAATPEGAEQLTPDLRGAAIVVKTYLSEAADYFYRHQPDLVYRVIIVAALAWVTGLGMGLSLPRFTTIVGTSCMGVLLIFLGVAVLASRHSPGVFETSQSHGKWVVGIVGVVLLGSLIVQSRPKRAVAAPPAPPPAAPKAP